MNKTHSNPLESHREAGGVKQRGIRAPKFMTGIKLISITHSILFYLSLFAHLVPSFTSSDDSLLVKSVLLVCSPLQERTATVTTTASYIYILIFLILPLTMASLVCISSEAEEATFWMIGAMLVGPYSWILGRQFWYASTTPWIPETHAHAGFFSCLLICLAVHLSVHCAPLTLHSQSSCTCKTIC